MQRFSAPRHNILCVNGSVTHIASVCVTHRDAPWRCALIAKATHMTFYTRNTEKPWTTDDIATLRKLVRENTPTRVIGLKLGRTEAAIYKKASELGLSLKPTNQSPYGNQ